MSSLIKEAVSLLREGRKFENQTVRNFTEMQIWRRKLDKFLSKFDGDDPSDSYDTVERIEHRAFVESLFRLK